MNQLIVSGASGFVSGIILARLSELPAIPLSWILIAGLILLGTALLLMTARKTLWPVAFLAFCCFGYANSSWHLDRTTPGHLHALMQQNQTLEAVTLEAVVMHPPDIRQRYTILPLKIIHLTTSDGLPATVKRGNLYAKIYPTIEKLYGNLKYGDRITLQNVTVRIPPAAPNPGGFDMQNFLFNQGYFAQVSVRKPEQITIQGSGSGSPIVKLAETVKAHLLHATRMTLPFPESSFLGGVLLGLRSGLSNEIKDTFRAAGVSHVLAVSGLHVTIITLFFMGIFNLMRIPRTPSFVIIVCALILFTLITGARPSTVRAAIMNSVTLLFFYYRGIKLDRSFLLGVSVAALFILTLNPMLLTEASFLFSFSAVLSLALLTRPIFSLCAKHLRGFFRIFLFFEIIIGSILTAVSPSTLTDHWEITLAAIILLPAGLLADRLLPPFFEFRKWPVWFSTFFAAQISIQLGMLPLTAYYFKKISVSAAMANFIAIPLIGVIVQLGLFAGILAVIPVIGPWIALTLNATNWLCIKLFLVTAHFFGTAFPYPDVSPPKPLFLAMYYCGLLTIAAWPWLKTHAGTRLRYLVSTWKSPPVIIRLCLLILPALVLVSQLILALTPAEPRLKITLLDPSVFNMGGGNAILIETPDNSRFLVDAGPRYVLKKDQPIAIKVGERTVTQALLDLGARHLDGVIVTSPQSGYAGGVASIIGNPSFTVEKIYHGLPFERLDGDETTDDVLKMLMDPALFQPKRRRQAELAAWAIQDLFETAQAANIPVVPVRTGSIIYNKTIPSKNGQKNFQITVLNPPENRFSGRYSTGSNSIVLQVDYNDRRVLLTSSIDKTAQSTILSAGGHFADVVQIPSNGSQYAFDREFIGDAKAVVVAPVPSRYAQKTLFGILSSLKNDGVKAFSTSEAGALTISSNGSDLLIQAYNSDDIEVIIP